MFELGSNPRPPPPNEPQNPGSDPGVDSVTYAPEIPTTTATPEEPVCKIKFDAISNIRGEIFLFKVKLTISIMYKFVCLFI